MFSHMYASVFGCLQPSFPLPEWIRCLGASQHEGSIPFTRFRPLVPRGLQRGAARNSLSTFCRTQTQRAKASRRSPAVAGRRRTSAMHYVYILESIATPGHYYIGYTAQLRDRVKKHQADVSSHAAKFRPWKLKLYLAFESKESALAFEQYLKSGSGRAFCKRHFA